MYINLHDTVLGSYNFYIIFPAGWLTNVVMVLVRLLFQLLGDGNNTYNKRYFCKC